MNIPKIPSIDKLFERMVDTQSLDEFIDVELELIEEVHAHNLSKETLNYYARIWRVVREQFYAKREEVTIEELNYGANGSEMRD